MVYQSNIGRYLKKVKITTVFQQKGGSKIKKTSIQGTYSPKIDQYSEQVVFSEQVTKATTILQSFELPNDYTARQKAISICEELKEQRKLHNLSQSELASKIDVKKEFITRIEYGKTDIQLSVFFKIFDGLGLKLSIQQKVGFQRIVKN